MLTIPKKEREHPLFLTYDLEWVPGTMELRICGVYEDGDYRMYRSVDEFVANELTHVNRGKWFYAHAGGMADFQFVLPVLLREGYYVEGTLSGSSIIIARVSRPGRNRKGQLVPGRNKWHFVDSYWLLRDKLRNVGEWLGAGYQKGNAEQSVDWYRTASDADLAVYNKQDCRILYAGIDRFETTFFELGGQLKKTQASCAMDLFRRRFLKTNLRTSDSINHYARNAYYASRVEVLAHTATDALYYDVNSSFPYAMTHMMPGELDRCSSELPESGVPYIADVEVEVPPMHLPPIPRRYGNRLFFPVGRWRGTYCGVDLALLGKVGGTIRKVFRVFTFKPFYDLRGYVDTLYGLRKVSEGFPKQVYKLALNSLYGKFGESEIKSSVVINPPQDKTADMIPSSVPGVHVLTREADIPHMHVPVAVYVTAIARRVLYDYMAQSKVVHYCDTDGFSTDSSTSFPDSKELGGLKLEKRIRQAWYVQPKVYALELADGTRVIKAKGFDTGAMRDDFAKFLALKDGQKLAITRMVRAMENLNKGIVGPREKTFFKGLNLKDAIHKRKTLPDGINTRAWSVDELDDLLGPPDSHEP